jgi:GNAT superfamily N-acetyltransferase
VSYAGGHGKYRLRYKFHPGFERDEIEAAETIEDLPPYAGHVRGLSLLRPLEGQAHAELVAAAFGGQEEMFLFSPDLLRFDGFRCYVGEADGRPVATAVGVTIGEFTEILNVATDPAGRRRGFGTAVIARAVDAPTSPPNPIVAKQEPDMFCQDPKDAVGALDKFCPAPTLPAVAL